MRHALLFDSEMRVKCQASRILLRPWFFKQPCDHRMRKTYQVCTMVGQAGNRTIRIYVGVPRRSGWAVSVEQSVRARSVWWVSHSILGWSFQWKLCMHATSVNCSNHFMPALMTSYAYVPGPRIVGPNLYNYLSNKTKYRDHRDSTSKRIHSTYKFLNKPCSAS